MLIYAAKLHSRLQKDNRHLPTLQCTCCFACILSRSYSFWDAHQLFVALMEAMNALVHSRWQSVNAHEVPAVLNFLKALASGELQY